jgi:tetrapyrrole methylase family protein / MazG family protein
MKGQKFLELVALVDQLRGPKGCPWDREQTFDTIKPMILEEVYEVLDALDSGNRLELCVELGDLLFQVVFLAQIAETEGSFQIDDVSERIVRKMIRRHPHVFGDTQVASSDEVLTNWEIIKRGEKTESRSVEKAGESILDGLPAMSALLTANKLTVKASRVGFDWSSVDKILLKIHEEINELKLAVETQQPGAVNSEVEQEVGDLLFSVVNVARFLKIDPETALRKANRKFKQRFQYVENRLAQGGRKINESSIDEMDRLWEEAKKLDS